MACPKMGALGTANEYGEIGDEENLPKGIIPIQYVMKLHHMQFIREP